METTITAQRELRIGGLYQIGNSQPPRMAKFKGRLGYRHFFVEWNTTEEYVCLHRIDCDEGLTSDTGIIPVEKMNPLRVGETFHRKTMSIESYASLVKDWEGIGKEK